MKVTQFVIPSGRSAPTISSSLTKASTAPTTCSVRSIEVPTGSSSSALKNGRSEGGKKMAGTKRKPAMASMKAPTIPAIVSARCLSTEMSTAR